MFPAYPSHGHRSIVPMMALMAALAPSSHAVAVAAEPSGSHTRTPADIEFTLIGHEGGPVRAVAALGRYALAGAGSRLLVFDVLPSRRPQLVFESQTLGAQVEGVVAAGPYAYVVAGDAGLFIYDVSTPTQPVLIGSLATPGAAQDVVVSGRYAYVAAQSAGLRIVDTSDVTKPMEVGFYDSSAFDILNVAVEGRYAYVTAGPSGLHVLDVGDPTVPVEVASLALSGTAKGISLGAEHAYIAAGDAGLRVVGIADPLQPLEVGSSLKSVPEDAHDVIVTGDHAYVADRGIFDEEGEQFFAGGMRTVDIASPTDPISVSNLVGDVWAIAVRSELAYLASYDTLSGYANSLDVVNVEDPADPRRLAVFAIPASMFASMVAWGSSLYLHDQGLSRIDLSDPTQPHLVWNLQLPGDSNSGTLPGLAVSDGYAYVGAGASGLHVVDLHDPKRPRWVTTLDSDAYEVAVQGNLAVISELFGGVSLVNITDPTDPVVVGTISGSWSARDLQAVGGYLYIAHYAFPLPSGLLIYDIADPAHPVLVGSRNTGSDSPRHVDVSGSYAYLAVGTLQGVLVVVDVSNPASPEFVSDLAFPAYFYDMTRSGDHILVTLPFIPGGGLRSIDVSNPTQPRIDGEYVMSRAFATSVAVLPGRIVALGSSALSGSAGPGLDVLRATNTSLAAP
jgi:hypothetical protein